MTTPRFDWALVPSFLAVLESGSMMAAARRLQARQPTLSRHIAELEAQLGVPLFERTGRGAVPTAAGLAIAEAARHMRQGAEQLGHTVQRRQQATSGTVRITSSEVASARLLPPVLAELQQAEPGIRIELVPSNAVANLLRREADIAVRMVRPAQGSLVARKLGEVLICAAAHERYLQRAGTPRTPQDLARHTLIGYLDDPTIERGFARLGLPLDSTHFALRTDHQLAYSELVAAGAGIGFLARYTLAGLPGVRPLLPMLKIPPMPCWLAVHREIRGNPVVRRVYDFLADRLPPLLAAGQG